MEANNVPLTAAHSLMVDPKADKFGIANVFWTTFSQLLHSLTVILPERTAVPRLP
jgi:hypothetical protein